MEPTQIHSHLGIGKTTRLVILGLLLLMPLFFLPSNAVSLYSAKIALLVTGVVILVALFLANVLSEGNIRIPRAKFLLPLVFLAVVSLVSSFFSGTVAYSIGGEIFDIGTSGAIFVLVLLLAISSFGVLEKPKVGREAIGVFLVSCGILILHLLIRIFGATLPAAIASRIPNFLVGGSIDTAIILSVGVIAALSLLNFGHISRKKERLLQALILLAMIFIGAVNFLPIIVMLGVTALVFFVYTLSWKVGSMESGEGMPEQKTNTALLPSLMVLIVSVVFVLSSGALSGYLSDALKLNALDVRPNTSTTMNMIKESWQQNPILGVGPNRFAELWDMHKPTEVNLTQFWNQGFSFGSGFIPTLAATTGVLGLVSILGFLVLFLFAGFKAIFSPSMDKESRFLSSSYFFMALFLWISTFVYAPSIAVMTLTFMFTGIFAATLVFQGVVGKLEFNIFQNPRTNFAAVLSMVVLLIASIAGGYFVWEKVVARSIFERGAQACGAGDIATSKAKIASAVRLSPTDAYWRGFAEVSLTELGGMLSSVSANNLTEAERISIQNLISEAIESGKQAVALNPKNFRNHFALARVYEILAANGIEGAAENAKASYTEAERLAPTNPAIALGFARLNALAGDLDVARENIVKAINLKPNYTDAYFTLAQLEAALNNIPGAIQSVEAATLLDPQNAGLYFQLGLLKYNQSDFVGAARSLERAVEIAPDYANARYFLGLSYNYLRNREGAITQFVEIQRTNPDNGEVKFILENLKAGRDPFSDARPPIDNTPETRPEPPIEEN